MASNSSFLRFKKFAYVSTTTSTIMRSRFVSFLSAGGISKARTQKIRKVKGYTEIELPHHLVALVNEEHCSFFRRQSFPAFHDLARCQILRMPASPCINRSTRLVMARLEISTHRCMFGLHLIQVNLHIVWISLVCHWSSSNFGGQDGVRRRTRIDLILM